MARLYNRRSQKATRQRLRREVPKAEEILWSKLRRRQMLGYKFRRQYSIEAFVVDFYCPVLRLAIEVDADSHFQTGSPVRDGARQVAIESFGIHFLRFRNVEVFEYLEVVLAAIKRRVLQLSGEA
jgi:very-short-patch-repair endonuclease